jgi:hypothetical protein
MRINVHIEHMVLDGVPVARYQAPRLQRALEAELRRLLAGEPESVVPPAGAAVPVLRAAMTAAGPGDADDWGQRIAGAVRGAMLP